MPTVTTRFALVALLAWLAVLPQELHAQQPQLIGYTQFQTNLPGGRHANVRTMRAMVMNADGTDPREIAASLADSRDSWTQFAGWSPDGKQAVVGRSWQDPDNAIWEERHRTFRMEPGKWLLDSCLVDLGTGKITNLSDVDRVSNYNGGLFFLPDGRGLGFTALIDGISKPYVMDLEGRNKRDVSGNGEGFTYGYSASPDGKLISYHENYQVYIADVGGSNKQHIETGNPFNFAPQWSPAGEWLLFLSGMHRHSNPFLVRPDGSDLHKLVDLGGYTSAIEFLDVPDFHQGSSDLPVWSNGGESVFYTAPVGQNIELFQTTHDGMVTQLTNASDGALHYHPVPSPDGKWLLYGVKRDGVRQLYAMQLADRTERKLTNLEPGRAAMWPHWQPSQSGR